MPTYDKHTNMHIRIVNTFTVTMWRVHSRKTYIQSEPWCPERHAAMPAARDHPIPAASRRRHLPTSMLYVSAASTPAASSTWQICAGSSWPPVTVTCCCWPGSDGGRPDSRADSTTAGGDGGGGCSTTGSSCWRLERLCTSIGNGILYLSFTWESVGTRERRPPVNRRLGHHPHTHISKNQRYFAIVSVFMVAYYTTKIHNPCQLLAIRTILISTGHGLSPINPSPPGLLAHVGEERERRLRRPRLVLRLMQNSRGSSAFLCNGEGNWFIQHRTQDR